MMTCINHRIKAYKPAVPRFILVVVAGFVWIGTAIMLSYLSYSWLRRETTRDAVIAAAAGIMSALLIHHFGFLRIADKNIGRIKAMEGPCCVFAFMPWKSYLLVMVMILMGIVLRHSFVPRLYLAALYTAIGTALFLSSIRYIRYFVGEVKKLPARQVACPLAQNDLHE